METINVTIAIPRELHKKMKAHEEISWSAVMRRIIEEKLKDIELLDKISSKSSLTDNDIQELAQKIDKNVAKKLGLL